MSMDNYYYSNNQNQFNNINNPNYESTQGYAENYSYFEPVQDHYPYNATHRDSNISRTYEQNVYLSSYEEERYGSVRREATFGTYQQYQCMLYGQQHPWQAFESSFCMQSFALPPTVPTKQKRPRMTMQKRLLVNARERERMRVLNKAFESLRDALPCYIADGHMAKITTLRLAINYIRALSELLNDQSKNEKSGKFTSCTENIQEHLFTSILKESSNDDEKLSEIILQDDQHSSDKTEEESYANEHV